MEACVVVLPSYAFDNERFDKARGVVGVCVQGLTYMPAEQAELRVMLCRWVPAFSKALMCHLRNEHEPAKELQVGAGAAAVVKSACLIPVLHAVYLNIMLSVALRSVLAQLWWLLLWMLLCCTGRRPG